MRNPSLIAREFAEKGYSESCPVIDMHGHYGPYQGIYFPSPWAEGMIQTMDRCGVRLTVSSSHASLVDMDRGNSLMAEVVASHPERFRGYWTINPNYPQKIECDLERFESLNGFVGFKFHPEFHNYPLTGERYKPALDYANSKGLVILTHTWGTSPHCGPSLLRSLAERYPRVTFLMGHSGYGEWEVATSVARDFPNVYLELTAAYAIGGVIEFMVKETGSEKMIFGTDIPWFDPHYGIGCVIFSRITDEDRHNILHRNAERILGLT
ncbi:MAG: amidohydrolase family protein [Firmicutes bacterium]|nr:amidohydrolase family protein [Bacillota bacterium]